MGTMTGPFIMGTFGMEIAIRELLTLSFPRRFRAQGTLCPCNHLHAKEIFKRRQNYNRGRYLHRNWSKKVVIWSRMRLGFKVIYDRWPQPEHYLWHYFDILFIASNYSIRYPNKVHMIRAFKKIFLNMIQKLHFHMNPALTLVFLHDSSLYLRNFQMIQA